MIKQITEPYKPVMTNPPKSHSPQNIKKVFPSNLAMKKKQLFYNGISRESMLSAYRLAKTVRTKEGVGQRTIARRITETFGLDISENTVSGWIYRGIVPYANEKTQFKAKKVPPKTHLVELYITQGKSAGQIAKHFGVSAATVISWINNVGITSRSHLESMNTSLVRQTLADKKLKKPKKPFTTLTPEKAYILGVMCGDGYVNKKVIKLEIRRDKEFIEKFEMCLKKVYGLKYSYIYYAKKDTLLLAISSMIIAKDIMGYDKFRTKSWRVPRQIMTSTNKKIGSDFLRGLFDSDGSVSGYRVGITCSSRLGLIDALNLLESLGITGRLRKDRGYSTISITGRRNIETFRDIVGFTIPRKMKKFNKMYKTKRVWQ